MLFISLVCLLMVVSCKNEKPNEDGLDKYRESGQLIDLDYDSFDKKLIDDESFVFFLKRNGCSSCAMFYPIVAEFLEANQDLKLYTNPITISVDSKLNKAVESPSKTSLREVLFTDTTR